MTAAVEDVPSMLRRLSGELRDWEERLRSGFDEPPAEQSSQAMRNPVAVAKAIYRHRRRREKIFGSTLFAEPAWDLMLDLFIAEAEDRQISVSSACLGSCAPTTTGLRWIQVLEESGLVVRMRDARDGRRTNVRLADDAKLRLASYLANVEID